MKKQSQQKAPGRAVFHKYLWLLLGCLLGGCAHGSRDLSQIADRKLQAGMTVDEVKKVLGQPQKHLPDSQAGAVAYYYSWSKNPQYSNPKLAYHGPTSVQLLSLRFDHKGKLVEHLVDSGGIIGNQMMLGGTSAGTLVEQPDDSRMVTGQTTLAKVVTMLGLPSVQAIHPSGQRAWHWIFVDSTDMAKPAVRELVLTSDQTGVITSSLQVENLHIPTVMFELNPPQRIQSYGGNPHEDLAPLGFAPFFR